MALRCLKLSSPRPLASIRLVGRIGNNISRPFAGVTNIPTIGYEHPPDVPSERVLSRLSIFGQRRDEPHIHTERKQGTVWRSPEAQRKEKEEVQNTAQQLEQEGPQKKDESATTSGPFPVNGCGDGGCVTGNQSEHEVHGSEGADTWTGTEASVSDYSNGYNGGYDGGGCGFIDGGWC